MEAHSVKRASAETVLAGVLTQGTMIVSGILVARLLGVENRGHLALMTLFPLIVALSGTLGLPTAVVYFLAQGHSGRGLLRTVRRPALRQLAVLTVVYAGILAVVFGDETTSVRTAAALSLLSLPAMVAQIWGLAILQGLRLYRAFNVMRAAPPLLYSAALIPIFLLDVKSIEVVAPVFAVTLLAGGGLALVAGLRGLRDEGKPPPALGDMYRFGLRGVVGWASPLESFQLDQLVVGLALSAVDLGLYVVAAAFTNLTRFFIPASLGAIAYPHIAAKRTRREAVRSLRRFALLALAVCGTAVAMLEAAIGWLIPTLFGDAFEGSVTLARILLVGSLFLGIRRVLSDGTRGAGHPSLGTIAEISTAVVAVPALVIGGSHGVEGVAWALTATYAGGLAIMLAMTVVVLRRDETAPTPVEAAPAPLDGAVETATIPRP